MLHEYHSEYRDSLATDALKLNRLIVINQQIHLRIHALNRMLQRHREWMSLSNEEIETRMIELVRHGTPVGGQISNNLAVEVQVTDTVKMYMVGHLTASTFVVRSALTREQLLANMGMQRLDGPKPPSSRQTRQRRRRTKKTQHFLREHETESDATLEDRPKRRRPEQPWDESTDGSW